MLDVIKLQILFPFIIIRTPFRQSLSVYIALWWTGFACACNFRYMGVYGCVGYIGIIIRFASTAIDNLPLRFNPKKAIVYVFCIMLCAQCILTLASTLVFASTHTQTHSPTQEKKNIVHQQKQTEKGEPRKSHKLKDEKRFPFA